jgi:hypothetical protein
LEKFERDNQNMRDSENSWNGDGNNLEIWESTRGGLEKNSGKIIYGLKDLGQFLERV